MRDSKDHATLELPGLMPAEPVMIPNLKRAAVGRTRKMAQLQVQLELLKPDSLPDSPAVQPEQNTNATGLSI